MALLTWICLLFLLVAVVGSIAFAAMRGLAAWRTFRKLTRATSAALDEVVAKGEAAERRAVALAGASERLTSSIAHLQESLAELTILRAAFANAKSGLTFRMPKK